VHTVILCGLNDADNAGEIEQCRSDRVDNCIAGEYELKFVGIKRTDAKDDSPVGIGMIDLHVGGRDHRP
jgi:hypothetical protein